MDNEHEQQFTVHGTPVVAGIAYAPAAWVRRPPVPEATAPALPEGERESACEDFDRAAREVAEALRERALSADGPASEVLNVSASLALDPSWTKSVKDWIRAGIRPPQAIVVASDKFIERFEQAGGALAERTTDLRDVRDRVLARLAGVEEPGVPVFDRPVVLLADDLSPADTAGLDPTQFLGIATQGGGPTSHTSIIARQLGIPCIVAARELWRIQEGTTVLLDGFIGTVVEGVSQSSAERLVAEDAERVERINRWKGPARTRDGVPVRLLANAQDAATAEQAATGPAQGIGLLRTEMGFQEKSSEPSVEQQSQDYRRVFEAFAGRMVVVRTLDAGSDKPVPFATLTHEANPALGVRGIRVTGQDQGILTRQLDAIRDAHNACPDTDVFVMAPMVSTLPEAEWFAGLCRERRLKPGIMVEVPSAAVLAPKFMAVVDFVSIGTNDLTQYTMAADRMSPHLAEYTDPWQPAVLELVRQVARTGRALGKRVSVCGESAADPLLACVLVGMGVTSLSLAPPAIAGVGAQLQQVTMGQCTQAAEAVEAAKDPGEARYLTRAALGMA